MKNSIVSIHLLNSIRDEIKEICESILNTQRITIDTSFFDMGADSLTIIKIYEAIQKQRQCDLTLTDIFRYPTINKLAHFLLNINVEIDAVNTIQPEVHENVTTESKKEIAVIGIGLRLPGAETPEEFWEALIDKKDFVTNCEMENTDTRYVNRAGILENIKKFDAAYFGFTKKEADLLDPQTRLLLECSVEALENGGQVSTSRQNIGVFVSINKSDYYKHHIAPRKDILQQVGEKRAIMFNDRSYVAGIIAAKLDLTGPSIHIDATCASSLIAIHQAVRALQSNECTMALAGGASILIPHEAGYLRGEAGIESEDGYCRPFDIHANGTVFSSGGGMVLLKPLTDARRDEDTIYAIIKGSAINNDGADCPGFTAPSITGQVAVIKKAQQDAAVKPEQINYLEAHGTGTKIGDPIELTALNEAFKDTPTSYRCALGAVKSNVGHLTMAAGVISFIKTVLVLKHQTMPPMLHFTAQNPKAPFATSPFYINEKTIKVDIQYAGISSFGLGGINAHMILSVADLTETTSSTPLPHLILLSAKSPASLQTWVKKSSDHLKKYPHQNLDQIAYTLAQRRNTFPVRKGIVADSTTNLIQQLDNIACTALNPLTEQPRIVFMFPGQGTQHVNMMRSLYNYYQEFAADINLCATILQTYLSIDIRELVFINDGVPDTSHKLKLSRYAQPILFSFEYSLAKLLIRAGIKPDAVMGHSFGEYAASCIAGIFSLEAALQLVCRRGALMDKAPPGSMIATWAMPTSNLLDKIMNYGCSIAAINSPHQVILSGSYEAITQAKDTLTTDGLLYSEINSLQAFHSSQMDTILPEFRDVVSIIHKNPPTLPLISNVTGKLISDEEAINDAYWIKHLRGTVEFYRGTQQLSAMGHVIAIEVGPKQTLSNLVNGQSVNLTVLPTCRSLKEEQSDLAIFHSALAQLWTLGLPLDAEYLFSQYQKFNAYLPTYAFDRNIHWLEATSSTAAIASTVNPKIIDAASMVRHTWQNLLGVEDVNESDDFFLLGGDSLGLVRMQRLFEAEYGMMIELEALYTHTKYTALISLINETAR